MLHHARLWALIAGCLLLSPLLAQIKPPTRLDSLAERVAEVGLRTWIDQGEVTKIGDNPPVVTFTSLERLQLGDRILLFDQPPPDAQLIAEAVVSSELRDRLCTARVVSVEKDQTLRVGLRAVLVPDPPMIGVLNFTRPNGGGTLLGQQLAEKAAAHLQEQVKATGFQVLEPFQVRRVLATNFLDEAMLFDPQRMSSYAKRPPFRLMVTGTVNIDGEQLWINARLVHVFSGRQLDTLRLSVPLTAGLENLFISPPALPEQLPTASPELIVALRQLIHNDKELQGLLRGPAGPAGPQGPMGPPPPPDLRPMLTPEQVEQVKRMLDTFGPVLAEIRGDLRALAERTAALEKAVEK